MVRQYIGARYVTKIYENSVDHSTADWEANVNYEPLTLVVYNMGSYLSKKEVPATVGDPVSNPEYWVQTGYYNGQIAALEAQVLTINGILSDRDIFVTPQMFGAVGDGVTDDTQAFVDAIADGKPVFIPEASYLVSGTLTLNRHNIIIVGVGT